MSGKWQWFSQSENHSCWGKLGWPQQWTQANSSVLCRGLAQTEGPVPGVSVTQTKAEPENEQLSLPFYFIQNSDKFNSVQKRCWHWRVQGRVNSWPLHPFAHCSSQMLLETWDRKLSQLFQGITSMYCWNQQRPNCLHKILMTMDAPLLSINRLLQINFQNTLTPCIFNKSNHVNSQENLS